MTFDNREAVLDRAFKMKKENDRLRSQAGVLEKTIRNMQVENDRLRRTISELQSIK